MWLKSSMDGSGVKTVYPPEPKEEDKESCGCCGNKVQFLFFYPEVLKYLKQYAAVPKFCSETCKKRFLHILKGFKHAGTE